MDYALPAHWQETALLLFAACCLLISSKAAALGAAGGFFYCFQKTENYLRATSQRLDSDQSPEIAQNRSLPETWPVALVAPTARTSPGYHQATGKVAPAGQTWKGILLKGSSLTSLLRQKEQTRSHTAGVTWRTYGHPARGRPQSPLVLPGRRPSYWGWEGLKAMCSLSFCTGWATAEPGPCLGLSYLTCEWSGGAGPDACTRRAGHQ